MADDLLSKYSDEDVAEFMEDFPEFLRVSSEIDRYYGNSEYQIEGYVSEFEVILADFNRKYKGIVLKLKKKVDSAELKVFVKENSLKDFFANSASRIKGLSSIGLKNFGEIEVSNTVKFAAMIDQIINSLFISYSDVDYGTSNVAAFLAKNGIIEIIIDPRHSSQNSADFRIAAFYALSTGVDRKINIHSKLSSFGFFNVLNEIEKREWLEKFSPIFME